jgi:hypothetical protein
MPILATLYDPGVFSVQFNSIFYSWDIELFFKQLKQTLKLSDFLGYSENAVQWQIWMALLTYIILRFIAYMSKWKGTFARLFTILRGVLWSRFELYDALKCCGTASSHQRTCMQPQQLYLPLFAGSREWVNGIQEELVILHETTICPVIH